MTPCMDMQKSKIQSYGSLDKLKPIIIVRGDLKNKDTIGDTWYPKESMSTLKYFLADYYKYKTRVHKFDFIGALNNPM